MGKNIIKNSFKKLLSIVAALAMVVTMNGINAVPVMAAGADQTVATGQGGSDTITIENAQPGQTYTLYKIFEVTTVDNRTSGGSGIAYNYTIGDSSKSLSTSYTYTGTDGQSHSVNGLTFFAVDEAGNVTANGDYDTVKGKLASEDFQNWAKQFGAQIGSGTTYNGSEAGNLIFTGLKDGYYFITSTTGSLVTVTSVAPNETVSDKNTAPDLSKSEDIKTSSVGDTVTYTIHISLPESSTKVIFHDRIDEALSLVTQRENVKLYVESATGTELVATNYTIDYWSDTQSTNNDKTKGDNITISFTDAYLGSLTSQQQIYLTYQVKFNEKAGVNKPNEAYVAYGDNSTESVHRKVYESSFAFKVNKLDGNNNPLSGAQFVLSTKGDLGNLTETTYSTHSSDLLSFNSSTGVYEPSGSNKLFTANNSITFSGLNDNENNNTAIIYYLYEVKAPNGYNKLTGPIAIRITPTFAESNTDPSQTQVVSYKVEYRLPSDNVSTDVFPHSSTLDNSTAEATGIDVNHNINIVNNAGSELPSTGGIGTTVFYVGGIALIAAAVIILVVRSRRNRDNYR